MRIPTLIVTLGALVLLAVSPRPAAATDAVPFTLPACPAAAAHPGPWAVDFTARDAVPAATATLFRLADAQDPPARRPVPVEYSEGYKTRAKIHKISSIATLPLFVANYFVGQELYNNPGDESMKGAHAGLVAATGVLFGVNTVTGAWNLWEGRKDPNHRAKRMTHGILMIAADVGFLATAMLAPESEEDEHYGNPGSTDGRSTHRAVALTSMGIATVSYLIMLFGGD
jgi:hypothetical protein